MQTIDPVQSNKPGPTNEQKKIIQAPATSCQLVISGPGTGKTYTLIRRLEYLITEGELEPHQILVLSFSRTAVREILDRLHRSIKTEGAHEDLACTTIRTFDSFAYGLLSSADLTPDITITTYDDTILKAAKEIRQEESDTSTELGNIQHIIIDEVQDLVGPRALFVQAMLETTRAGFTLLGDPAQAIYDYQVREKGGPSATEFLTWVQDRQRPWELQINHLTKNMRATGSCFAYADRYRKQILDRNIFTHKAMLKELPTLPAAGKVIQLGNVLKHIEQGKTATILCRTNNEALHLHSTLKYQNIPHTLATDIDNVGLPPWLGRIFSNWTLPKVDRAQFLERWRELIGDRLSTDPEQAWNILVRIMEKPINTQSLKMDELRKWLTGRTDLPVFSTESEPPLRVSTIHRAKGREYDLVTILVPDTFDTSYQEAREESRVLYVAATRPRQQLFHLARAGLPPSMWSITAQCGKNRGIARSTSYHLLVEIGLPGDVNPVSMVSTSLENDATKIQEYLWSSIGKDLEVKLWHVREGYKSRYYIYAPSGMMLGEMSANFGSDMWNVSSRFGYGTPMDSVEKVGVGGIRTIILPSQYPSLQKPFRDTGIFLSLRLEGIVFAGNYKWKKN